MERRRGPTSTSTRSRFGLFVVVCALLGACLAAGLALPGATDAWAADGEPTSSRAGDAVSPEQAAPAAADESVLDRTAAVSEATSLSYEEWKSLYPTQYGSFATHYYNEGASEDFSHFAMKVKEEAYYSPDYPKTGYCMSCKGTSFDAMYAEEGDAMFQTKEDDAHYEQRIGTYYDCATCHADPNAIEATPNLQVFQAVAAEEFADVDAKTLVCGQCHYYGGEFTTIMREGYGLDECEPYLYGHDAAGMYLAAIKDMAAEDEATGALLATPSYSDLEMFVDSTHASMGLTCVDCHMPQTVDENGNAFTSHNASSSPLENPDAIATCLTCHSAQGVEDAEGMRDYYATAEKVVHDKMDAAAAKVDELREALTEATAAGSTGNAIDEARELYGQAYFYTGYVSSYRHGEGYRVAHNAEQMGELADQILQFANDGLDKLA